MRRREFMGGLMSASVMRPLAARAQRVEQAKRVGVLLGWTYGAPQSGPFLATFLAALQQLGWVEGRNISITYEWAGSDVERIQTSAKELIDLKPDLIVAHSTPVVAALHHLTNRLPIVFVTVSDPVGSGFFASLPRPGGNMTGFINIEASLGGKWVELLKEVAPSLARVGIIFNPETATHADYYLRPFEVAALSYAADPVKISVHRSEELEPAIRNLVAEGSSLGLAVMPDIFTADKGHFDLIITLAARYRLPAIYPYRYMATAGGLISYGIDNGDLWRRAPTYIDRILKGAKPNDLPVQLPTKFELAVNLKAAKALGLDVPLHLQQLADEVIE
jgi:putative tryptophan/tyrosine transport system substrate-binding protein